MKQAVAGTLESSDILIAISESAAGTAIIVDSIVQQQFGAAIEAAIADMLRIHRLTNVRVAATDKGALDCTIRARMETAISRYLELAA